MTLVMELLGKDLNTIFQNCDKHFPINSVSLLGLQMLKRLKTVHSKSFIHRDVKPNNFTIGLGKQSNSIYIIDFGLANRYQESKSDFHIPYRTNKSLIGTIRYASINNHMGIEQSRRDDLESLMYVLIMFAKGNLPWSKVHSHSLIEKQRLVMNSKISIPIELLCKGLHKSFIDCLHYVRYLKFEEKPDYSYIRQLLYKLLPNSSITPLLDLKKITTLATSKSIKVKSISIINKENKNKNENDKKSIYARSNKNTPRSYAISNKTLVSENKLEVFDDKEEEIPDERMTPNINLLIPFFKYENNNPFNNFRGKTIIPNRLSKSHHQLLKGFMTIIRSSN